MKAAVNGAVYILSQEQKSVTITSLTQENNSDTSKI